MPPVPRTKQIARKTTDGRAPVVQSTVHITNIITTTTGGRAPVTQSPVRITNIVTATIGGRAPYRPTVAQSSVHITNIVTATTATRATAQPTSKKPASTTQKSTVQAASKSRGLVITPSPAKPRQKNGPGAVKSESTTSKLAKPKAAPRPQASKAPTSTTVHSNLKNPTTKKTAAKKPEGPASQKMSISFNPPTGQGGGKGKQAVRFTTTWG